MESGTKIKKYLSGDIVVITPDHNVYDFDTYVSKVYGAKPKWAIQYKYTYFQKTRKNF